MVLPKLLRLLPFRKAQANPFKLDKQSTVLQLQALYPLAFHKVLADRLLLAQALTAQCPCQHQGFLQ
jgi:hypothetical protein